MKSNAIHVPPSQSQLREHPQPCPWLKNIQIFSLEVLVMHLKMKREEIQHVKPPLYMVKMSSGTNIV